MVSSKIEERSEELARVHRRVFGPGKKQKNSARRRDARSDEKILERARRGKNGPRFAALYDRFAPAVRAVCWGELGRVGDAQDLTQEVFLRVYRKLGELKNFERFGPWVVAILHSSGDIVQPHFLVVAAVRHLMPSRMEGHRIKRALLRERDQFLLREATALNSWGAFVVLQGGSTA